MLAFGYLGVKDSILRFEKQGSCCVPTSPVCPRQDASGTPLFIKRPTSAFKEGPAVALMAVSTSKFTKAFQKMPGHRAFKLNTTQRIWHSDYKLGSPSVHGTAM